jgi:uncharacterized protein YggT (Ycf19 family)
MVVFDAIDNVQLFVDIFASVYGGAILLYIILSMLAGFGVRLPYSLRPIHRFLDDVCEPYLAFWRRLLPFLRIGMFDLSPIVALIALGIGARIVIALLEGLQ